MDELDEILKDLDDYPKDNLLTKEEIQNLLENGDFGKANTSILDNVFTLDEIVA